MLYVIATPIGNLSDITYRAIETLRSCDYVLCEDTRHSVILLRHYEIHVPLKSFHKFSESAKEPEVMKMLHQGMKIGLISDAGTPGISDPGQKLIHQCLEEDIPVTPIPGSCAAITALCCSGLNTDRFQFFGFLPRKEGELRHALQEILFYAGTTICYESPNRLKETLEILHQLTPNRQVVVARELTKKFEEVKRGTASQLIEYWNTGQIKGEIVLMIAGDTKTDECLWDHISPQEHVALLQAEYGLSKQDAICTAAKIRNTRKRDIYNATLNKIAPENETDLI